MHKIATLVVLVFCTATHAWAQFGGRAGDVVLYVVTAKGSSDFKVVPYSTVNTNTGFVIEDPNDLPLEPFGPDFPAEFRHKMHADTGDVFNLIIQREVEDSPHQELLAPVKVFLIAGMLRLKPINEPIVDVAPGLYVPFPRSIDFGPNEAVFEGHYLFWTAYPTFPATRKADPDYRSPVVPPQFKSGIDYLLSLGTFDALIPWIALKNQYSGAGWQQGIDTKVLDNDTDQGVTVRLLRLRPGRKTPAFLINANTHLWVLQGKVTITPADGTPAVMHQNIYAFVPPGFAVQLSNPVDYTDAGSN